MAQGFRLRIEEYVPAGTFLKTSFSRDRAELATRFSEFTPAFEAEFQDQLQKVDQLEQTLKLTKEQKKVTITLYEQADVLNSELNFLAFYFKRAGLDNAILSQVKRDLRVKNIEGACYKMSGLIQYVTENQAVLSSKGMAPDFTSTLITVKDSLAERNALQNEIMNIKKQLYDDNSKEYKKLYEYIATIATAAKIMYTDTRKIDEYTVSKIISRMRLVKIEETDAVPA